MSETLRTRLAIAGTVCTVIIIWMLRHPYNGIENNDAALYSLLALARLHPQSLSADVFLRFGSQDTYTMFGPLYAAAIRLFDLEPAAALLSFAGQLVLFVCGWLFARSVMSARLALLAVGLFIALPSNYGAVHTFKYIESYLTPRQLAEAATLAALAASMTGRYALTCACMLAAMLLHPIMGLAGIVALTCLHLALPRPRLALVVVTGVALLSLVPTVIIPLGALAPFDREWLKMTAATAPYLFLWQWQFEDWVHLALPIAVLTLGASTTSAQPVRILCRAALLTGACGVAATWIYCDFLHSVIFTQMQPWRWLWLAESIGVLLLPIIARDCWQSGPSGRAALMLLAAAWMLSDSTDDPVLASVCLVFSSVACATILLRNPRVTQAVFLGSCLLLVCTLICNLAFKSQYVALNPVSESPQPLLNAHALYVWSRDGVLCCFALFTAWSFIERQGCRAGTLLQCASAGIACVLLSPFAWQSWTDFQYSPRLRAVFAPWRQLIPQGAQVVWPHNPMGAWYLLERPSYYSLHQLAGDLFSRAKAIEIHRRGHLIASVSPTAQTSELPLDADSLNVKGLEALCSDPELDFYVSWASLGPTPAGLIVPNPAEPRNQLHLYRCADLRDGSG